GFGRTLPETGRFRYFLLGSLRNYVVSQARRDGALKRGGSAEFIPLDVQQAEEAFLFLVGEAASPERAYDRQWAQTVWSRALGRLREEYRARGKEQLYENLKPSLTTDPREASSGLAAEAGLSSSALAVAVHRLRRRLRELVLDELCATVEKPADLDDELNYFLSIWVQ
ncbi:MAG: RNA polymerase sigma factor, partial [Limisphaerales bacterium]